VRALDRLCDFLNLTLQDFVMSIEQALQTLSDSSIPTAIREGALWFPLVETGHVICVAIVLGTISIVDLRLMGVPAHRASADRLIRELLPFTWGAFILAALFGAALFSSNAPVYFGNVAFRVKIAIMAVAGVNMGIFHLVTQRNIAQWDQDRMPPVGARIAGLCSLALWIVLVFFARRVGFTLR
jgi:hypothetical protein